MLSATSPKIFLFQRSRNPQGPGNTEAVSLPSRLVISQNGLRLPQDRLGQEVCELLQGGLCEASIYPQVWRQEAVRGLQSIEGSLSHRTTTPSDVIMQMTSRKTWPSTLYATLYATDGGVQVVANMFRPRPASETNPPDLQDRQQL